MLQIERQEKLDLLAKNQQLLTNIAKQAELQAQKTPSFISSGNVATNESQKA